MLAGASSPCSRRAHLVLGRNPCEVEQARMFSNLASLGQGVQRAVDKEQRVGRYFCGYANRHTQVAVDALVAGVGVDAVGLE